MKQILKVILKFSISIIAFISSIMITSGKDIRHGSYFFQIKSSELSAKRDVGMELPFPEQEINGTGKTNESVSEERIKILPVEKTPQIDNSKINLEEKKKNKIFKIEKNIASIQKISRLQENISDTNKEKSNYPTKTTKEIKSKKELTTKIETPPLSILDSQKQSLLKKDIPQNKDEKKSDDSSSKIMPENLPKYIKGLYITNHTLLDTEKFSQLKKSAKSTGINTFVIDVQPKMIPRSMIDSLEKENFYLVARVVNFDGGLKDDFPSQKKIDKLKNIVKSACESGFKEIQFDYIRYSDRNLKGLSTQKKYKNISKIIEELKTSGRQCDKNLVFGADIFGRIPFVKHDRIGQNLENFASMVDAIYPMLYPSHFYGEKKKINNPYQTVFDGVVNSLKRSNKNTRIIPYIQGFSMAIKGSGLGLKNYIKAQIRAAKESNSHGFVVWNAKNDYKETFNALK